MPNGQLIRLSILIPKELDDLIVFIQKAKGVLSKSELIRELIKAGIDKQDKPYKDFMKESDKINEKQNK